VLEIDDLHSAYGRIEVLKGVNLKVQAGEVVALIGSNGAGKTTLMRALSGVQPITAGSIKFLGERIERLPAHARVKRGVVQSPEGRHVFGPLSVEDNLSLGGYVRRDKEIEADRQRVYAMFPILHEKRQLLAGGLSGGQQQMLAIGRGLASSPKLLMLDEPSMGLAPTIADFIFERLIEIRRQSKLTILLVEQRVAEALESADHGYVLEAGRVALEGNNQTLRADDRVRKAYLGM
jgi:branched-chain amino acid transport system ATP-binding protein